LREKNTHTQILTNITKLRRVETRREKWGFRKKKRKKEKGTIWKTGER
jgi:hypothetical protein